MGWSCPYCTLINEEQLAICDGCGSLRVKTEDGPRGLRHTLKNAVNGAVAAITNMIDEVVDTASSSLSVSPFAVPAPQPAPYSVFNPVEVPSSPSSLSESFSNSSPRTVVPLNDSSIVGGSVTPLTQMRKASAASLNGHSRPSSSYASSPMQKEALRAEKIANGKLKEIALLCSQLKTNFVDDEFPPTEKSIGNLYGPGDEAIPGRLALSDIVWLRPGAIYSKDGNRYPWSVFNDPSSSDIEQGALGDCWFLSALALIAERPDVLSKIFLTKTYNEMGVYQLRLCVDGLWKTVTIDDHLPCKRRSKHIAFAIGRKNQLWVPLVEKAYAKALGGYEKLRAGRTVEGLALLTGAPCESIALQDDDLDSDIVWAQMLSSKEAGYIMGASCGAGGSNKVSPEVSRSLGLLTQHAYSILDVKQEATHRLLRVRNPWGTHSWTGAWSDGWNGWPADIKRRLLPSGRSANGVFWMSFDDFLLHFDAVDIAKIRDHLHWAELRVPCPIGGAWGADSIALMLVVEQPTELCVSLFRGGSRSGDDSEDLLINVHHVDPKGRVGELAVRSARSLSHMETTGDVFLRSGHYVITVFSLSSFSRDSFRMQATLVVHSNKLLFGEAIYCPPQMATDSLIQLCLKEGRKQKSLPGVTTRFLTKHFGGLIAMVDNTLPRSYVHTMSDCTRSMNVLSTRGGLMMLDVIPPMSRQILVIMTHFDSSNSYSVENRLSSRSTHSPAIQSDWLSLVPAHQSHSISMQHIPSVEGGTLSHLHSPRHIYY